METLELKLLRRAIGQKKIHQSIKPLYGDRTWVEDLDIVNELGGHTGCVNALSWSSTGRFLASGSDDTYLNIWDYNPTSLAKPFSLNTSVSTGHSANIFSVKFMPHSNDRTVVTCAGDSEVRVFDLEYGGSAVSDGGHSESTRSRRFNTFFGNARWLNEANTNARVYRSHSDRAKRVVTESSPYLFLTASEDGEVRQWDLRLPSSAYPAPHGARRTRMRTTSDDEGTGRVPPPLISYKKYALDLNTISCSGSQPHYIALGGAHLHCFLHDRRMLGRDISAEQGRPVGTSSIAGTNEDEIMREATKCVRRFAPNNKRKMGSHDTGHITACKISDARPNELISSWSGDHVYSFDIVKSPDAKDVEVKQNLQAKATRLRNQSERKRKRAQASGRSPNAAEIDISPRPHQPDDNPETIVDTALRVRYENGDSEDIPLHPQINLSASTAHATLLSEAQKQSGRVARALVQLRKTLFDFSASLHEGQVDSTLPSQELTSYTTNFTSALGQASSILPDMEDIMRSWSYPMNPSDDVVAFQTTLRQNRQAAWRFVQAAGCLSKILGGKLQTLSSVPDPRLRYFDQIKPAPREEHHGTTISIFYYDFLKAILLWIRGGAIDVLQGFRKPSDIRGMAQRFPLDEADTPETMPDKLQNYLVSNIDRSLPVIDLGTDRFERDEYRNVFESQEAAVTAFMKVLTGVELELNHGPAGIETLEVGGSPSKTVMDKGAAARFWGLKVGRSLLLEAADGVNFAVVNQAFGGARVRVVDDIENFGHAPHVLSSDTERIVEAIDILGSSLPINLQHTSEGAGNSPPIELTNIVSSSVDNLEMDQAMTSSTDQAELVEGEAIGEQQEYPQQMEEDQDESEDNDDSNDNDNDDDDDADDDDGDDDGPTHPLFRRRIAYGRSRERAAVNLDVPYSSHTKIYKGHCNTRTVKDVNYYGLDDEYVVSGSDDGHFFIWDRRTGQIVNILEGDGEVVNVVQGHPYEPMIACSGIDSTIKIFGSGGTSRERHDAITGVNVANPGGTAHSSLRFDSRTPRTSTTKSDEDHLRENNDAELESILAQNGLRSRRAMNKQYEITSRNDAMRRDGLGDAFVTEGMLARLAAVLQQGGQIPGIAGEDGTVVIDQDNCMVM